MLQTATSYSRTGYRPTTTMPVVSTSRTTPSPAAAPPAVARTDAPKVISVSVTSMDLSLEGEREERIGGAEHEVTLHGHLRW